MHYRIGCWMRFALGVSWVVLKEVRQDSGQQMERIHPIEDGNTRLVQQLHDREVEE